MSNSDNHHHLGDGVNIVTRKKRRGMIEKRRRDKINNSLTELRRLVPAAFEKQGSAKLEKAEILQMTVDYLRMLHARGLADSLTHNKETIAISSCADLDCVSQGDRETSMQSTNQVPVYHSENSQQSHIKHQTKVITQQSQAVCNFTPATVELNTPSMSAGSFLAPTPDISSRHLYSQHHHMLAEQAVYHHHLNGTSDMASMISHHNASTSATSHHAPIGQHSHQQHPTSPMVKTHLKIENHCHPQVMGQSAHPSLLNLDHQAHSQVHSHHHQLSARYGHHAATINPYLAAYPTIPSNVSHNSHTASSQLPGAIAACETLQSQSVTSIEHHRNSLFNDHMQPQLTQLDTRSPSSANGTNSDSNSHQQVSSSSSPSHSTSESSSSAASASTTSAASNSQRHYRPWGAGLAY